MNGDIVDGAFSVGWLNHILGTEFSMKKRFRLWENAEKIAAGQRDYDRRFTEEELMQMIPYSLKYAAGGVELTDLLYICKGTASLTEEKITAGTYPEDIYRCKIALERFFEGNQSEADVQKIWDFLTKSREERAGTEDAALTEIGRYSLILPARVIVYLTAELKKMNFWECWEKLHDSVYHDEQMKEYASEEVRAERKEAIETPIEPVRTSEFLRQDDYFTFWDNPKELKGKPNYYISDDDRMYWWDGSDEVIISEKTDEWLKNLAVRHQEILKDIGEEPVSSDGFLKEFLMLLVECDQYYKHIFPFQSMFYEFLQNGSKPEFRAAVKLLKQIADENREDGKIIEKLHGDWDLASRNVTHNAGRIHIKRYLSIMANLSLRKKYFGF